MITSLGIISVQEMHLKRKGLTRIPIEIKRFTNQDIPFTVANIFCDKDYFLKNRFLKNRTYRLLKKSGMDVICMEEKEEIRFCREIYKNEMYDAVSYALRYIKGNPLGKTAWFSDISGEELKLNILSLVSQKIQHLGVKTKNIKKAELLADELCEEYGVHLEIQNEDFLIPGYASMIIDFDANKIKMGHDFFIDGRELYLDLQGYHIDIPWLVSTHPDFSQKLVHKAWLFGKKRLTR